MDQPLADALVDRRGGSSHPDGEAGARTATASDTSSSTSASGGSSGGGSSGGGSSDGGSSQPLVPVPGTPLEVNTATSAANLLSQADEGSGSPTSETSRTGPGVAGIEQIPRERDDTEGSLTSGAAAESEQVSTDPDNAATNLLEGLMPSGERHSTQGSRASGATANPGAASAGTDTTAPQPDASPNTATTSPAIDEIAKALQRQERAARNAEDPAVGRARQVQSEVQLANATSAPPIENPVPILGSLAGSLDRLGERVAEPILITTTNTASGSEQDPAARVIRGLSTMVNQRGGVMSMKLAPPELGQLRIEMSINQGVVTARFQPATMEAQSILNRSMPALRASLESHGLTVERLTVQAPAAQTQHGGARQEAHDQESANQQHARNDTDAGGSQSRGHREEQPGNEPTLHVGADDAADHRSFAVDLADVGDTAGSNES